MRAGLPPAEKNSSFYEPQRRSPNVLRRQISRDHTQFSEQQSNMRMSANVNSSQSNFNKAPVIDRRDSNMTPSGVNQRRMPPSHYSAQQNHGANQRRQQMIDSQEERDS